MRITMTFPQSQRHEATINYKTVDLPPKAHGLLEALLMNRGLWCEWETLCRHLEILPHPGWRATLDALRATLSAHGVKVERCFRTGYRLPLDTNRLHKLEVVA